MTPKRRKSSLPEQTGLPKVGSDRLVELGDALREHYAEIEKEPIPDRLQALIDRLKEAESREQSDDQD
ncbi:MAG: NepR family anti-sigma factor [Hyphomonadaceae bacterium]|nr:NepR family anti-sigma factor [Hyphomonadaceae bacterium]